jgi:hypothetical protein
MEAFLNAVEANKVIENINQEEIYSNLRAKLGGF